MSMFDDNIEHCIAKSGRYQRAEAREHAAITEANERRASFRHTEPKSIHSPAGKPLQRFEAPTPKYARRCKPFSQR